MIRPHSLDPETILRLRLLAATTYSGRDDLYAAASQVSNEDLAIICRRLADDLAGNTAFLEQIIAIHGAEPGFKEAVASALGEEIMRLLREGHGDHGVISVVQAEQRSLRGEYEATIAATHDAEAQRCSSDKGAMLISPSECCVRSRPLILTSRRGEATIRSETTQGKNIICE